LERSPQVVFVHGTWAKHFVKAKKKKKRIFAVFKRGGLVVVIAKRKTKAGFFEGKRFSLRTKKERSPARKNRWPVAYAGGTQPWGGRGGGKGSSSLSREEEGRRSPKEAKGDGAVPGGFRTPTNSGEKEGMLRSPRLKEVPEEEFASVAKKSGRLSKATKGGLT